MGSSHLLRCPGLVGEAGHNRIAKASAQSKVWLPFIVNTHTHTPCRRSHTHAHMHTCKHKHSHIHTHTHTHTHSVGGARDDNSTTRTSLFVNAPLGTQETAGRIC